MAKYHINDKDEVKVCKARFNCRFGGESGSERHFTSKDEAEKFIQKEYESKYSITKGLKKANVLNKLVDKGITVNKISDVNDYDFNKFSDSTSTIDVLDEKPTVDWLKEVRNGSFKF